MFDDVLLLIFVHTFVLIFVQVFYIISTQFQKLEKLLQDTW